jgi:hypothetical protein
MDKKRNLRSEAEISKAEVIVDFSRVRQQLLAIADNVPTVAQIIKHEIYDEQRHARQVSAFLEDVVSPTLDT